MRDFIVPLTRSQGRAARPYGINPGKRHGNAGDRRPPDNTFALQQIARDIAPGLKSVYIPSDPAPPKKSKGAGTISTGWPCNAVE